MEALAGVDVTNQGPLARDMIHKVNQHMDLRDGVAALGLALVSAGVGFIFWPAALIVAGAALLYLALGGVRRGPSK